MEERDLEDPLKFCLLEKKKKTHLYKYDPTSVETDQCNITSISIHVHVETVITINNIDRESSQLNLFFLLSAIPFISDSTQVI